MTIPWAITGLAIEEMEDKGLTMAFMNLSQCIPEIFAAFAGHAILSWHKGGTYGQATVLAAGGTIQLRPPSQLLTPSPP